ncbi:glycosyl hydrolase family 8 [Paenibacillus piscarius]|uniref:glycosyl hydrolase family 8 n=1 Tax=Paenibacillus piscarius TaxID=1089681 RepID=UPI001EE8694F|nr:glycosyl hydrolase family 8 [Paenibacillus piscarius]
MGYRFSTMAALGMTVLLLTSCGGNAVPPAGTPAASAAASTRPEEVQREPGPEQQQLLHFIDTQLMGSHGVYTNLQETGESAEMATGHEVLSESASLMMEAAVRMGDQERFGRQWALARRTFDMEGGFSYRFSPKLEKRYPVNAAVDDLRMIGALYEAGQQFGQPEYTEEAEKYGIRFYKNNAKNGYIYDIYDNFFKVVNGFVTLCYIDLGVMQNLSISSESRESLLHNMTGILEEGYLSDSFPFYETRFDYSTKQYRSEGINTVESLLSILHLAELGLQKPASIRYITEHVEAGTLYGKYTRDGEPMNDVRSTAIYALTAMIGAELDDSSLYQSSIARMNEFRVTDAASPLYGGFGDPAGKQAYSFDNLMALLAYSYKAQ